MADDEKGFEPGVDITAGVIAVASASIARLATRKRFLENPETMFVGGLHAQR